MSVSVTKVPQRYVVQFSGGVTSWAAARRLVDQHGADQVLLLLANTNSEAEDWWPFVQACQQDLGVEMVVLDNDGMTIWDAFRKHRFLGNTRVDICSRALKREPLRAWLETNCDPAYHRIVMGFDWDEEHRAKRTAERWLPWQVECPMAGPPYTDKAALIEDLRARGIQVPDLYSQGFDHNNCAGTCVKGGQAHWRRVLLLRRDDYLRAEGEEEKLRAELGDVAILRDRTGGTSTPLPLRSFRLQLAGRPDDYDGEDFGACSCMEGDDGPLSQELLFTAADLA